MQGRNENILSSTDKINAFQKKRIGAGNLEMFPSTPSNFPKIAQLILNHLDSFLINLYNYFPSISVDQYNWVRSSFVEFEPFEEQFTLTEEEVASVLSRRRRRRRRRRRHRLKGIHSRPDTNRTGAEGLSFYYPRLLHCLDQMLAAMLLSQHRVSSSKTVRPRAPCGARCMETLLVHGLRFALRCRTRNSVKERDPICAWTNGIAQHQSAGG